VDRTSVQIFTGAAILVVIDALLGLRTARRSRGASSIASFVCLALVNEAIVALGRLTRGDEQLPLGNTIFFALLTLIVTLYDRFEPYHGVRFGESPPRPPVLRASWTARRRFAKVGAFRCDRKEFRHGVHFGAGKQGDRGG
jgi:hypothetical protein